MTREEALERRIAAAIDPWSHPETMARAVVHELGLTVDVMLRHVVAPTSYTLAPTKRDGIWRVEGSDVLLITSDQHRPMFGGPAFGMPMTCVTGPDEPMNVDEFIEEW